MSAEQNYETQRIDHLGIVAGVCHEISLIEQIDEQVKASERKVSSGRGAQALILNALGFVGRALYLTPDYLSNKPVDLLIGTDLCAEDFNPDSPCGICPSAWLVCASCGRAIQIIPSGRPRTDRCRTSRQELP